MFQFVLEAWSRHWHDKTRGFHHVSLRNPLKSQNFAVWLFKIHSRFLISMCYHHKSFRVSWKISSSHPKSSFINHLNNQVAGKKSPFDLASPSLISTLKRRESGGNTSTLPSMGSKHKIRTEPPALSKFVLCDTLNHWCPKFTSQLLDDNGIIMGKYDGMSGSYHMFPYFPIIDVPSSHWLTKKEGFV